MLKVRIIVNIKDLTKRIKPKRGISEIRNDLPACFSPQKYISPTNTTFNSSRIIQPKSKSYSI